MDLNTLSAADTNGDLIKELRSKILPVIIFIGSEIFVGLIGNVIVLFVYGFRYEKTTYRCFILFLGLIDLISCLTTMSAEVVSEYFWFNYEFTAVCKIKSFFNIFTVSADVLCLVAISIDRYKQICLPYTTQMSPLLASYLCAGISMTTGIMAIPAGVISGLNHANYTGTYNGNTTNITMCGVSDHYKDTYFDQIYVITLQAIIGLSLLGMLIVYIAIVSKLCCVGEDQDSSLPLLKEDRTLDPGTRRQTLVMFTVSLFFTITVITYLVLDYFIAKKLEHFSLEHTVLFLAFFRLYFVNHVLNTFIYGCLDNKFRQTLSLSCTKKVVDQSKLNSFTIKP